LTARSFELEWQLNDGSIVKAHQHSSSAVSKESERIGKSVADKTTEIHLAVV